MVAKKSVSVDDAAYDFVVDAIDTLAPKCHLIAESMKRHIKIVRCV